jgi:outer membrane lipoprotein
MKCARTLLQSSIALLTALAGCAAQPPSKGPIKDITPLQAIETNSTGDEVRWGGPILSIAPKQGETCFRMLSYFLGSNGEPHLQDQPRGHFLACAKGHYDPAVYAPRRLMTFVGTVGPAQTVNVDNVEHKVATVDVQAVKLWPAPPRAAVIYTDPWYGPCCGPYIPGYPVYAPYPY